MEEIELKNSNYPCRLCAKNNETLFKYANLENYSELSEQILDFTKVNITKSEYLSEFICADCINKINEINEFRILCINNQIILAKKHETQNSKEIESSECNLKDEQLDSDSSETDNLSNEETTDFNEEINIGKLKYKSLLRPCDKCGKFVEKSRMKSHINRHLGIQPFTCNIPDCNKKFYCSYTLTNHKRNHHSTNIYSCDICGNTYRFQKSLYNHKQKHKEPRYICSICGIKYTLSSYLKQHMRTHTGERPYKCKNCPRAFASSYNLKCHIRSHTKEKPYSCDACGVSYGYNSLLKLHKEKCHLK